MYEKNSDIMHTKALTQLAFPGVFQEISDGIITTANRGKIKSNLEDIKKIIKASTKIPGNTYAPKESFVNYNYPININICFIIIFIICIMYIWLFN